MRKQEAGKKHVGDKRQETRGKEMNGNGPCENGQQQGAEKKKKKKKRKEKDEEK